MSANDKGVLAVMDRAAPIIGNSDHGDAYAVLTAWPEARAAVAELVEALQRIADGNVMRGEFTASDTIHEYQSIARAALARVQGGAA